MFSLRDSLLVDDHGGGEPALRGPAVGVDVVVGPDPLVAVLLNVGLAGAALPAAPDDHPDADDVADAVLAHLRPDLHHLADHLMPEKVSAITTKRVFPTLSVPINMRSSCAVGESFGEVGFSHGSQNDGSSSRLGIMKRIGMIGFLVSKKSTKVVFILCFKLNNAVVVDSNSRRSEE